ncbi:MAG TPA: T9SS type A sorting domain-containing protein, partial [Saprospiraceae bacterium]|nr:T9SS type A sorting domain-containing protein [Saprospiraceae bacterium]
GNALSTISNEITVSLWAYGSPKFLPAQSTLFEGGDINNNRVINVHLPWEDENVYWDCGRNAGGDVNRINKANATKEYKAQWSHWAFTKNSTTGSMKIYLNGKLWHSGTGKNYPIDLKSLNFGSAIAWSSNYFGSIDEFQVWDKALDEATIASWMRKAITPAHPQYSHLVAYFPLDEGQGNAMASSAGIAQSGNITLPNWQKIKGVELYKNFSSTTVRPNLIFEKGDFITTDIQVPVIDSVLNSQNQVVHYGTKGTDLIAIDTQYVYHAGFNYVYDENGNKIDSVNVSKQATISINNFFYYGKRQSRFELVSLVTPYGINLDLGKEGKTFTFDVTDYAPILKGKKFVSIEYGGEWQEELDIKFLFIKGTPPKTVRNIQNIWPEGRGYHGDIQADNVFEKRQIILDPGASYFKLRSAVSGHGGNGEFVPQQHFLNINEGVQEFTYDVWKPCSRNPIFPQGGTWVFDRAGWCPGMATDVHEFDMTPNVSPGSVVSIDYGINGNPLGDANYLVSNQLVSYGAYNFNLDASLETIMRPNNKSVEFARINPSCNTPTVLIRNTGAAIINTVEIEYNVIGGAIKNYTWSGSIEPMMSSEIILPVAFPGFWYSTQTNKIFEAKIVKVNGVKDNYAENDRAESSFTLAKEMNFSDPLQIRLKTNLHGEDNSYTILDSDGKIVLSRNNMANSTTYVDEIDVAPGCYTFKFEDNAGDGLSFWYFPDYGNGTLRLERLFNGTIQIAQQTFNPDMGGGVQFDFVRGAITATEDIKTYTLFSIYPNPTEDLLNIELHGFDREKMQVSIVDLSGRELKKKSIQVIGEKFFDTISIGDLSAGMYLLKVNNGSKVWIKQVIKE